MKIDGFGFNNYAIQNNNQIKNSEAHNTNVRANEVQTSTKSAFNIKDTYEPSATRPDTNYGGYNKSGNYIVNRYSNFLRTDEEGMSVRMKNAGLSTEDLVNPEKATKLSDEPAQKAAIQDFATKERESLLYDAGMSDEEFNDFINTIMK